MNRDGRLLNRMTTAVERKPKRGYAPSMTPIEPQRKITVTVSKELEEAIERYRARKKLSPSEFGRLAFATLLGKPSLADTVKMGRPRGKK